MSTRRIRYVTQEELVSHEDMNRAYDEDHVYALMQHMQDFGGYNENYPIETMEIDGELHIFSGHHWFAAAFGRNLTFPLLPIEKVPVTVVKGDFDALVERMWNAHDENNPKKNPAFGLQLSRAQETAQRLIQLSFPHIYRQSSNQLGELWNTSRKTVDRLRQKFKEQLWDIVKLNLPPDALLQRYHYTPERLATMVELVKSGDGITVQMNSRQRITRRRCSSEVNGRTAGMTNRGNSCEFPKKIVFFEKIDCFFEKNVIFA